MTNLLFLFIEVFVVFSFILVPVGIAIELAVVGILLSDANGGDYGKAVYDSLTSIALNCI